MNTQFLLPNFSSMLRAYAGAGRYTRRTELGGRVYAFPALWVDPGVFLHYGIADALGVILWEYTATYDSEQYIEGDVFLGGVTREMSSSDRGAFFSG